MSTGLDPEFLVLDGSNRIVPASLFLEYDAGHPITNSKYRVGYDNAAVEIRPTSGRCLQGLSGRTKKYLLRAYKQMRLARMRGEIPAGSRPSAIPAAKLHGKHMELESVQVFGCDPAYFIDEDGALGRAVPLIDPFETPYRSAGYHIHQSFGDHLSEDAAIASAAPITMVLDALIGLVDVLMLDRAGWLEHGRIRRSVIGYGRAGEFRVHGATNGIYEYRTMSPWPLTSPVWSWWVHSAVRQIASRADNKSSNNIKRLMSRLPDRSEITYAINECDPDAALALWKATLNVYRRTSVFKMSPGTNSLTSNNIRALIWALNNGGHRVYTLDYPMPKMWYINTNNRRMPKKIKKIKNSPTFSRPGRKGMWRRPRKRMRYFPSGSRWYHKSIRGEKDYPPPIDLDEFVA